MKTFRTPLKAVAIASRLPGRSILPNELILTNVAELQEANAQSVCFFENPKYLDDLKQTEAGLLLVPADFDISVKPQTNLILVEKPYVMFMMLVKTWLELDRPPQQKRIAASAVIAVSAVIGANVVIGENCVIGAKTIIGDGTRIDSNTVLAENVQVGRNCHLFPNITIYEDCLIKNKVIIHAGCVIGADGFGYLMHEGIQNKIPQVGNVIIEDDVEIGANSAIDRATIGSTIIGKGTKIDNLVQVGHNCIIGENSILCAQVGLAGSTVIGNVVYLAGQVGVAGHLKIDDGAMVGAQSGVSHTIPKGEKVFGTPAINVGLRRRILASEKKLPEIVRHYNKLLKKEKEI
ncbi:MAG: UDP-3-O-(3-hydroxymyristoyl)glucosamine N-acyltransferase [Candidatus Cloacimonadales bacterium]|nr:UDP-3-O-(3-hydroxymyristoyl)glucosamine N-acyltransferase [Candidatus Cloacimonadales bacterium]